jgi:hypothetical protein
MLARQALYETLPKYSSDPSRLKRQTVNERFFYKTLSNELVDVDNEKRFLYEVANLDELVFNNAYILV